MYYALCLCSMIGYALQGTLMAGVYRRIDPQSATAARGLSLAITMLPLLLFVPREAFLRLPAFLPAIGTAGLLASIGVWFMAHAYRYLPVGITNAMLAMLNAVLVALMGMVVFREFLSPLQIGLIALILLCVTLLGMTRSPLSINRIGKPLHGVALCALFSLFVSAALIILSATSRSLNPLLTGYLWETTIGLFATIIALVRSAIYKRPTLRITPRELARITLFSAPTAIGTGAYMLAVTLGPVAIASAINSTTIIVSTLLARIIFKERISTRQWILLLIACLLVIALFMT